MLGSLVVIVFGLVAVLGSAIILATNKTTLPDVLKDHPLVYGVFLVTGFAVFLVVPGHLGEIARDEASLLPWNVFIENFQRHGVLDGVGASIFNFLFLLWVLVVPAHLYVEHRDNGEIEYKGHIYLSNLFFGGVVCVLLALGEF